MKIKCQECKKLRDIPKQFNTFPLCAECRKCDSCQEIILVDKLFLYQTYNTFYKRLNDKKKECWECWEAESNLSLRKIARNLTIYDLDKKEKQATFYENRLENLENRIKELEAENKELKNRVKELEENKEQSETTSEGFEAKIEQRPASPPFNPWTD